MQKWYEQSVLHLNIESGCKCVKVKNHICICECNLLKSFFMLFLFDLFCLKASELEEVPEYFTDLGFYSWNLADHRIPVNTIQALVSGSFGRSKTFELYPKCFARSVFIQFFYWSGNIYRHIRWSKLWKLVAKLATISISALLTCWSCWEWLTTSGFMQPLASCGLKQSVLVSYLAIHGIAAWFGAYHKHKVRTESRRGFCA